MDRITSIVLICILVFIILLSLIVLIKNHTRRIKNKINIAKNIQVTFYNKLTDKDFVIAITNLLKMKMMIDQDYNVNNREALHNMIDELYKELMSE